MRFKLEDSSSLTVLNDFSGTDWDEQIITVTANLIRHSKEFNNIEFFLKAYDYIKFMRLEGTYKGHYVGEKSDIVFKFLPNDILIITSDNVQKVMEEYLKKKEAEEKEQERIDKERDKAWFETPGVKRRFII